jgi:hypothetical protein
MIFEKVKKLFDQINDSLAQIDDHDYTTPIEAFDGATIGQHTRHVVEHFQCLVHSRDSKFINYDDRKRSLPLESNIESCVVEINNLIRTIESEDFELEITQDFLNNDHRNAKILSSYYREVLYNMDHLVHHQALMKIGFLQLKPSMHISKNFGYADATIKHKVNVHAELPSS